MKKSKLTDSQIIDAIKRAHKHGLIASARCIAACSLSALFYPARRLHLFSRTPHPRRYCG